MNQVGPESISE